MNKILIGIIAVIISVYPYNSYSKELSLEHQLFDKNNVGKINWKTVVNSKRFNNRIVRTVKDKNIPTTWQYYGEIILSDVPLELGIGLNNNKKLTSINVSAFKNSPQSKISIKNKVIGIYGKDYIVHKRKINTSKDEYLIFETMQWNIGVTRINFITLLSTMKDSQTKNIESLVIGHKDNLKEVTPISFITCSQNIFHSSGNNSKLNDMTIGIDESNSIVIDINYNELKYKIDGDYIKLYISDNEKTINTVISRTTGKLTSTIEIDNTVTQISGTCIPQPNIRLF